MTAQPAAHKSTPWFSAIEPSMPYKANTARRHKFTKTKYHVTNWPEYDASLVRRGSLTVWVTDEDVVAWHGFRQNSRQWSDRMTVTSPGQAAAMTRSAIYPWRRKRRRRELVGVA